MAALYKGYSSYEFERKKTFELTDIELVKMDLLNHIFTRRGTRVMMPTFGTSVPDLVFEPLDLATTDALEDELRRVIAFDPRVNLLSFDLATDPDNHTIRANIRLFYIELEIADDFELNLQFET